MKKKRIIILGGGFADVKCAHTLIRELSRNDAEIVLFNAENHLPVVKCRSHRQMVGCLRTRRLRAQVFSKVKRPMPAHATMAVA